MVEKPIFQAQSVWNFIYIRDSNAKHDVLKSLRIKNERTKIISKLFSIGIFQFSNTKEYISMST